MYIPNADTRLRRPDGRPRLPDAAGTGGAWSALTALTTPRAGASVSDLLVDPADASRIWATHRTIGGGRVFRSDDGGTTWTDRTAGLPGLPINAIEVDSGQREPGLGRRRPRRLPDH